MARELKELRNTMAMGFFMLNALFTVVVFVMQRNVDQVTVDMTIILVRIKQAECKL